MTDISDPQMGEWTDPDRRAELLASQRPTDLYAEGRWVPGADRLRRNAVTPRPLAADAPPSQAPQHGPEWVVHLPGVSVRLPEGHKAPNAFQRWMQRKMFGFRWVRIDRP